MKHVCWLVVVFLWWYSSLLKLDYDVCAKDDGRQLFHLGNLLNIIAGKPWRGFPQSLYWLYFGSCSSVASAKFLKVSGSHFLSRGWLSVQSIVHVISLLSHEALWCDLSPFNFYLTISKLSYHSCSQFSLFSTKREISDTVLFWWTNFSFIWVAFWLKVQTSPRSLSYVASWSAQNISANITSAWHLPKWWHSSRLYFFVIDERARSYNIYWSWSLHRYF